ncbi:hypothetical protein EV182_002863 [Spiromyces aspiralis]|uniref:Uncharacterized protein n=1 Tax=Spiromyces aspiralis TaxID=68401 RepID=A0ACC1HF60_9FUNG|nr:hypothetical protein EV182_002863 [Spiromyces aspiralis]
MANDGIKPLSLSVSGISASERGHQASQRARARARRDGSCRLASAEARAAKEPAALTGTLRVGSEAVPKAKSVRPNGGVRGLQERPELSTNAELTKLPGRVAVPRRGRGRRRWRGGGCRAATQVDFLDDALEEMQGLGPALIHIDGVRWRGSEEEGEVYKRVHT